MGVKEKINEFNRCVKSADRITSKTKNNDKNKNKQTNTATYSLGQVPLRK